VTELTQDCDLLPPRVRPFLCWLRIWRQTLVQPDKHFNDVRFWPKVDMRWTSVQLDFDHCSLHRHVVLRALLVTFGKETEVNTWISRSLLLGILSSVCGVTIASAPAAGSRRGADWPHS